MLPILSIGRLSIQTAGLLAIFGIWLGLLHVEAYTKRSRLNPDTYSTLAMIVLITGLVSARVAYLAQNSANFMHDPWAVFALSPTMLDPISGALMGLLAGFIYGRRKQLPFWMSLDLFTPLLAIWMIFLGCIHLATGDAFGAPSQLPWSIYLYGEWRHPTQVYEILSAIVVGNIVWPRPYQVDRLPGLRFLIFVCLTAFVRIFLEFFQGDSALVIGNLRSAQLNSLVFLVTAGVIMLQRIRKYEAANPPTPQE